MDGSIAPFTLHIQDGISEPIYCPAVLYKGYNSGIGGSLLTLLQAATRCSEIGATVLAQCLYIRGEVELRAKGCEVSITFYCDTSHRGCFFLRFSCVYGETT